MLASLAGGMLIGLAASLALLSAGKVAGVSGLLGQILSLRNEGSAPAFPLAFVVGLLLVGATARLSHATNSDLLPGALADSLSSLPGPTSALKLALAGLLVGYGTRLARGCTSGHGVCGVSRLSPRSLVATGVFLGVGMLTATLTG